MTKWSGNRFGFSATSAAFGGVFSMFDQFFLRDDNKWQGSPASKLIGGTTATPGNGYTYRTFTSTGPLLVTTPLTVDILIVAGGGAGGTGTSPRRPGGGGGAGGIVYFPNVSISTGSYTVGVGAGAPNSLSDGNPSYILNPNGSTFGLAVGGGSGGISEIRAGNPGGSGGGAPPAAGTATQPTTPNSGGTNYGNPGSPDRGGGGAGAAGSRSGGNGVYVSSGGFSGPLIGQPGLAPLNGYFGGGGGGGGSFPVDTNNAGGGGLGGGMDGRGLSPQGALNPIPTPAVANSGGGGGGGAGSNTGDPNSPYAGGSGIVVLRFLV